MNPTNRTWMLLVVAAVPYAAAPWSPELVWIGLALDGLLAAALVGDWLLTPGPGRLSARLITDAVGSLGDEHVVRVEVSNDGGVSGAAELRLPWPETWSGTARPESFGLAGRGRTEVRLSAVPNRRGRFQLGPVWVRYRSVLGLLRRTAVCDARAEVRVYPAVASLRKYQLLVRRLRLREMGLRAQRQRGQGMEFARLREYVRGDDPRQVDWKATARRGSLITREFQVERCQNIILMIDAGRHATEEVDGRTKIEYVLHSALLLARVAAEYDDRIGALVFSDRVERDVPARKGRAAIAALSEALFDVEPRLVESDYDFAFQTLQASHRKRALVVLFTNIVDEQTSGLVTAYLSAAARRHVPLCVAVSDRETAAMAQRRAATEEEAYRKAGAARLLVERERAIQSLKRRGVHVVDAPAGEVPIAVANRYLDLKARQIL